MELNTFLTILNMMLISKILLSGFGHTNIDLDAHELFMDLNLKQCRKCPKFTSLVSEYSTSSIIFNACFRCMILNYFNMIYLFKSEMQIVIWNQKYIYFLIKILQNIVGTSWNTFKKLKSVSYNLLVFFTIQ